MDVEILSRIQFAFTIAFHYIYPPLSIGLGLIMVIMEGKYLKTGNKEYEILARFWTKIFALTFGLGVATGIVMEFEFGTNWATYSRFVGDVFGSALAAEGIFLKSGTHPRAYGNFARLLGRYVRGKKVIPLTAATTGTSRASRSCSTCP